jgi:methylated-DNA-[protein]-cysteine S-methyltransferase
MMKYAKTYQTPIGMMTLIATDDAVEEIVFDDGITANGLENDVMKQASEELREYFHGERISFSFPIHIIGTPFQKKVWHALMEIPYGETVTYREIACKVGNPKASRAVGMANHRNRLPIVIPCHRVIGSNGKMVGYALGLAKKEYLLEMEQRNMSFVTKIQNV